MFPSPNGISTTLSPLAVVNGADKPDFNHLKLEFGTFVHIFNDNKPTNTMAQRITGAIALNSTGKTKGDYFFLIWRQVSVSHDTNGLYCLCQTR